MYSGPRQRIDQPEEVRKLIRLEALRTFAEGVITALPNIKPIRPHTGFCFSYKPDYRAIFVTGFGPQRRRDLWDLLQPALTQQLAELHKGPDNPAVSYRNFDAVTAVLANRRGRGVGRGLAIVLGGNVSPYGGVQRRCAERQAALGCYGLGLAPFGAVTGISVQADDTTGVASSSGLLLPCCDCRHELPQDFGWSSRLPMRFFNWADSSHAECTTLGKILMQYAEYDRIHTRQAIRRAHGWP